MKNFSTIIIGLILLSVIGFLVYKIYESSIASKTATDATVKNDLNNTYTATNEEIATMMSGVDYSGAFSQSKDGTTSKAVNFGQRNLGY